MAGDYPSNTVTIMVPSKPGGSIDRLARSVQKYLGDELGAAVNVENVPGAGTKIALAQFAESDPDGHTIIVHQTPTILQAVQGQSDLPGLEDLAIINVPWADPGILVSQPGKWGSLEEFVADARTNPGTYTFGSSNAAAVGTVLAVNLFDQLGLDIKIVPYDGGGETRSAFLGGLVDMTAAGAQGALALKGKADPLAVFWDEAVAGWEDAPLIGDAVANLDVKPTNGAAVRFFATHKAFAENNPDAYSQLLAAFKGLQDNQEYLDNAAETKVGADWRGPDTSLDLLNGQVDDFLPILMK